MGTYRVLLFYATALLAVQAQLAAARAGAERRLAEVIHNYFAPGGGNLGQQQAASLVADKLHSSLECSKGALCVDELNERYARAAVALAAPDNIFCSGTLINGPGGAPYILTALHCLASSDAFKPLLWPLSDWAVYFNYHLDNCNESSADGGRLTWSRGSDGDAVASSSITRDDAFFAGDPDDLVKYASEVLQPSYAASRHVLQGLSLVWHDAATDVMLLELLDDIPSAWNVMRAGWSALPPPFPFNWLAGSHPRGDVLKAHRGVSHAGLNFGNHAVYLVGTTYPDSTALTTLDISSATAEELCTGEGGAACAYYHTVTVEGPLEPGSSGAGLLHSETGLVVGTLYAGITGSRVCELQAAGAIEQWAVNVATGSAPASQRQEVDSNIFGSMAMAWRNGMWAVLGGESAEQPAEAGWEEHKPGRVGVIVANSAPMVFENGLPETMAVRLTQAPDEGEYIIVGVMLQPSNGDDLPALSVLPTALVFTVDTWNKEQFVTLVQGRSDDAGAATQAINFNIVIQLTSNQDAGFQHNKTLTGTYMPAVPGNDWSNPINVPQLPYIGTISLSNYTPISALQQERMGPFHGPTIFYRVMPWEATGVVVNICSGSQSFQPRAKFHNPDRTANFILQSVTPSLQVEGASICYRLFAALQPGVSKYLMVYKDYPLALPGGTPGRLDGSVEVEMQQQPITEALYELALNDRNPTVWAVLSVPYTFEGSFSRELGVYMFLIQREDNLVLDITTCNNGTETGTSLSLLDGNSLQDIRSTSGTLGQDCVGLIGMPLTGGRPYIILAQQDSRVQRTSRGTKFVLAVSESEVDGAEEFLV